MAKPEVLYSRLRPQQFRERLQEKPLAYIPLGTVEWHGEHLPLGADALQAEGLMFECARRFGGIVYPAIHLAPDRSEVDENGREFYGVDFGENSFKQYDGSCYWVEDDFFIELLDNILKQLKRAGFKAVFADGHGPSRKFWAQQADTFSEKHGLKIFSVHKDFKDLWNYQCDHAARNETSGTMLLHPDLVDLSVLSEDRQIFPEGVYGEDPRDSSSEFGKELFENALQLLGEAIKKSNL